MVERLEEAASAASERGASEPAVEYLRRALTEPPGGADGVRLRFRYALARLGQGDRAISDLTRSVLAIPESERPAAALEASRALGLFTEHAAALEVCASVPDGIADPAVASRLSDEVMVHMLPVGPEIWRESSPADVLAAAPEPPDPGAEALRVVSNTLVAVKAGQPVSGERLTEAVQGLMSEFPSLAFAAAGPRVGLVRRAGDRAEHGRRGDRLQPQRRLADRGRPVDVGRRVGLPARRANPRGLAQGAASVEFNSGRPPPTIAWPLATLDRVLVLLGELDLASEASNLVPDRSDGYLSTATLTEAVGRLALATRRDPARGAAARGCGSPVRRDGIRGAAGFRLAELSRRGPGRRGRARAAHVPSRRHELEIAERTTSPRAIGEAQRALALCEARPMIDSAYSRSPCARFAPHPRASSSPGR